MIPTGWLYRILGAALGVAALMWLIQSRDHWRDRARTNEQLYVKEQAAHSATVAGYRAAAEKARRQDLDHVARVNSAQAAINKRTENDYQSRIVSARARADRVRRQAGRAQADPGAGRAAGLPAVSVSAEGTAQAAGENGLSRSDRLTATEQAIQLDELIKWVRRQQAVESEDVAPPGGN